MIDVPGRIQEALRARYRIERELGSGGMAVVYLADDLKHGRRVAIKVLRPELVPTLGAERFLREIGIAARLAHPNIVPLHDSGEADGLLYYVMPFVEGNHYGIVFAVRVSFLSLMRCGSRTRLPMLSPSHTPRGSFIATSSPRTCCFRQGMPSLLTSESHVRYTPLAGIRSPSREWWSARSPT